MSTAVSNPGKPLIKSALSHDELHQIVEAYLLRLPNDGSSLHLQLTSYRQGDVEISRINDQLYNEISLLTPNQGTPTIEIVTFNEIKDQLKSYLITRMTYMMSSGERILIYNRFSHFNLPRRKVITDDLYEEWTDGVLLLSASLFKGKLNGLGIKWMILPEPALSDDPYLWNSTYCLVPLVYEAYFIDDREVSKSTYISATATIISNMTLFPYDIEQEIANYL